MALRQSRAAFKEWFIPKRRRWVGGAMVVVWAIGLIIHPAIHWSWGNIGGLGLFWFISAWPPELHEKR